MRDLIVLQINVQLAEGGCAIKSFTAKIPHNTSVLDFSNMLDKLKAEASEWFRSSKKMIKHKNKCIEVLLKTGEALSVYVVHTPDCVSGEDTADETWCDCGLVEVLRAWKIASYEVGERDGRRLDKPEFSFLTGSSL